MYKTYIIEILLWDVVRKGYIVVDTKEVQLSTNNEIVEAAKEFKEETIEETGYSQDELQFTWYEVK